MEVFRKDLAEQIGGVFLALQRSAEADTVLVAVVGSNIFNILCILGVTAMISPIAVAGRFASVDGPIMIVVAVAAAAYLFWFRSIGRGVGVGLVAVYAAYIAIQNAV